MAYPQSAFGRDNFFEKNCSISPNHLVNMYVLIFGDHVDKINKTFSNREQKPMLGSVSIAGFFENK